MLNENGAVTIMTTPSPMDEACGALEKVPQRERLPDSDAIKMFVGQLPRDMNEAQLIEFFEVYGPVYHLNVLRDKATGKSKGCCFVTFFSRKAALDAQNALHDIKTMPGMYHPVQMKPADTDNRSDRKLFVGMLSRNMDESQVRQLFEAYGSVDDCTILRDTDGSSRGCAFVTYASRASALNAIRRLHQSKQFEGCNLPLVVKLADTPKDKEHKRAQAAASNMINVSSNYGSSATLSNHSPAALSISPAIPQQQNQQPSLQHMLSGGVGVGSGSGWTNVLALLASNLQQQQQAQQPQPQFYGGSLSSFQPSYNALSAFAANQALRAGDLSNTGGTNNSVVSSLLSAALTGAPLAPTIPQSYAATAVKAAPYPSSGTLLASLGTQMVPSCTAEPVAMLASPYPAFAGPGCAVTGQPIAMSSTANGSLPVSFASLTPGGTTGMAYDPLAQAYSGIRQYTAALAKPVNTAPLSISTSTHRQQEGPEGANLFIYHLPSEFGDADLIQTFTPFGSILSAKVFIDKVTKLSKCFGFVSYERPESAAGAIQAMNGFQIGNKRLKVQLKRSKQDMKPYTHHTYSNGSTTSSTSSQHSPYPALASLAGTA